MPRETGSENMDNTIEEGGKWIEHQDGSFELLNKKEVEIAKARKEEIKRAEEILGHIASAKFFSSGSRGDVHGYIEGVKRIKEEYNLPDEIFMRNIQRVLDSCISMGYQHYLLVATSICREFDIPIESAVSSYHVKCSLEKLFERRNFESVKEMRDYAFATQELVNETGGRWIMDWLSTSMGVDMKPYIAQVKQVKEDLNIPQEVLMRYVKMAMMWRIHQYSISYAIELGKEFDVSQDDLHALVIEEFNKNEWHSALSIMNGFGIKMSSQDMISACPNISLFIDRVERLVPGFKDRSLKSVELFLMLFDFLKDPDTFINLIEKNPFLVQAIESNPRYGHKLLIKYPKFDELSRENISFLFNGKKEILAENSELDQNSADFRKSMQEKLKDYKNNPQILASIEKSGVNLDEWLNYSEVEYFSLGEEEEVPFSEIIATPVDRIGETIDAYAKTIIEKLKDYKAELSAFKIPLGDEKEKSAQVLKMEDELQKTRLLPEEWRNKKDKTRDEVASSLEKAIELLRNKKEKTVSLWNKLSGDIDAFKILKSGVVEANEELKKVEKDLQEKLQSEKRPPTKEIKELKKKVTVLKENIRSKFKTLEIRMEDFRTRLSDLISSSLGEDRANTIVQEIQMDLAEQFDHYNTDRSTLADLFSENGDKKKKLEKQPMSVSVWSRNPDIDLYQGNYSPCCICIESAHMGVESTIADYNTDLGVQIVNIWDESENKPVVAAWCWLSEKGGSPVLVVDNIEANTLYSTSYPDQLTQKLFSYLENYAKKIGAKRIVLGKINNDLPTRDKQKDLKDDTEKYQKLGGYNREGGYYLESEKASVKVVYKEEI